MGKRLLTPDYDDIVFGTFKLPESDFYKYYSNVIDDNVSDNSDIFQEIIASINRWIEWYRKQHLHDYGFAGQTWEVDEEGNKTLLNPDDTSIPLLTPFGIMRHINKSFFDKQIEVISNQKSLYLANRTLDLLKQIKFPDEQQSEKTGPKKIIIDTLEKACNGSKEYETLIAWFVEKDLCYPITYKWKGILTELANYLKDLNGKGYTKKLKQLEFIAIAENSFKVKMSRRTLSGSKGNHYTISLPEIPNFQNQ